MESALDLLTLRSPRYVIGGPHTHSRVLTRSAVLFRFVKLFIGDTTVSEHGGAWGSLKCEGWLQHTHGNGNCARRRGREHIGCSDALTWYFFLHPAISYYHQQRRNKWHLFVSELRGPSRANLRIQIFHTNVSNDIKKLFFLFIAWLEKRDLVVNKAITSTA